MTWMSSWVERPSRVAGAIKRIGWLTVPQATLGVIVLGLVWRAVRYAVAFPLWGDEAFLAVNFLTRDLAGLGKVLEFKQVAPPAFLWAEYAVARVLGGSEWSLRLLPFLAGVASLGLFWRLCQDVATRRVTLVAVALFAASLFPVRHATEVKPYAFDLLISLVVTSLAWSVWREPGPGRRWLALTAAGAAGVWCSYTAVFPVSSAGLLLLARGWRGGSWRVLARASAFSLASGLSWAVMMVTFARPQLGESSWLVTNWGDGFPPLSEPWRLPFWLLEVHTGAMMAYPHGGRNFASVGTALLVALGVAAVSRRRLRRPLLFLLLGPLPVALAAAALRRYPYGISTRLMLYMAPAFCLLAGEGVVALLRAGRVVRRGPVAAAGLLALVSVVGTVCDLSMPYRRSGDLEYRRFARRLAGQAAPGDRWVVFDGVEGLPDQPWVMNSVWVQRVAKLRYYLLSRAPVPVRWESDPRNVGPNPGGRTWLIVHDHGFGPIYPQTLRAVYEPIVRARLGPPRSSRQALPVGSIVEVHAFEPSVGPLGESRVAEVPGGVRARR